MVTAAVDAREGPQGVRFLRRLEFRLPVTIGILLAGVVSVVAWLAYAEMRDDALASAGTRVSDACRRLADLTERSTVAMFQATERFAARPELRAALGPPAEDLDARSRAFLEPVVRANVQNVAIELWGTDGTLRLSVLHDEIPHAAEAAGVAPTWADPGRPCVGALREWRGEVVLPVAAPVRDGDAMLGHLVVVRRVSTSPESLDLLGDLIGAEARVIVEDAHGTWCDFSAIVEGPPAEVVETPFTYADSAGRRWLGAREPLPGYGWRLCVLQPLDTVTARAEAFAARTTRVGAMVVLAGALAGWLLSRRITRPLGALTRAADAMAAGDLAQRVPARGPGEVARLGAAFNAMADHVQATNRDMERRIEERTAQLTAAVSELEAFSYSVSHDLRAPLRAVNGFGAILREDHAPRLDDDGRDLLDRVIDGSRKMERLIDDILELSRVSRTEMRREPVDLSREAEDVVGVLRAGWPGRVVDVRVAPGLRASGDARLLRLVLQNLLGNAWKFTAKRDVAHVEVGREEGPDGAFYVRDDGAGFDMTYVGKLFGVFQRVHSTKEFPGTGVGLAIVQRIVQRHGGRVWAEGRVGEGATFRFTLRGEE